MIWALDLDDFSGRQCGAGSYPLLNAINIAFGVDVDSGVPNQTLTVGSVLPSLVHPRHQSTSSRGVVSPTLKRPLHGAAAADEPLLRRPPSPETVASTARTTSQATVVVSTTAPVRQQKEHEQDRKSTVATATHLRSYSAVTDRPSLTSHNGLYRPITSVVVSSPIPWSYPCTACSDWVRYNDDGNLMMMTTTKIMMIVVFIIIMNDSDSRI